MKWSYESIYDVADIADYIEREFDITRADKFNDEIDERVETLSYLHSVYSDTGIYYRGMVIQKMPFNPSIVFFTVDDINRVVYILRVLRHERDWQTILRKQIIYTFD